MKTIPRRLATGFLAGALIAAGVGVHAQERGAKWLVATARDMLQPETVRMQSFAPDTSYAVCFTPGQNCEAMIVHEIDSARTSILMQAYSFTSTPIAKALADAKSRGVDVRAILDKSQRSERYTGATFLRNAGIPVLIDEKPAIAHSKIIIVDSNSVLTGSFNFTRSAQDRNAENLIIIKGDAAVVRAYTQNWNVRYRVSVEF